MDWPSHPAPSNDNKSLTRVRPGTVAWRGLADVMGRTDTADGEVTPRAQGLLHAVGQVKGPASEQHINIEEGLSCCDTYGLWSGKTFDTNLTWQPSRPRSAPHAAEISHISSTPPPAEVSLAGWGAPSSSSRIQSPALACPRQGDSAASSFTFPQGEIGTSSWQAWKADWRADNKATTVHRDPTEQVDDTRTSIQDLQQQLTNALAATAAAIQQQQRDQISYQQQLAELSSRHLAAEAAGSSKVAMLMEQLRQVGARNDRLREELTAAQHAHDQEAQKAETCQRLLTEARQLAKTAVDCSDRQQQQLRVARQQKQQIEATAAATLQQQQDDHQRELDAALASNADLADQVAALSNRVEVLEADQRAAHDNCSDLTAQHKQLLKDLEHYQKACQPSRQLGPWSSMRWVLSKDARANSKAAVTAHKGLLVKVKGLVVAASGEADSVEAAAAVEAPAVVEAAATVEAAAAVEADAPREDDRLVDSS